MYLDSWEELLAKLWAIRFEDFAFSANGSKEAALPAWVISAALVRGDCSQVSDAVSFCCVHW
jgi:hypothetical protein